MELVPCALCKSEQYADHFEQQGFDEYKSLVGLDSAASKWVKCKKCGLIYHRPQLSNGELQVLYDKFRDDTIREETPDEYFDRITNYPPDESENYQKVQWIIKVFSKEIHERFFSSIFDIGCGGGVFLWTARELMNINKIVGLEPTKSFAELAARRLNAKIFNQAYESPVEDFGKHDLITVNQVLEHIKDPKMFVSNLRKNLVKGGYVYIEVPSERDFESLPSDHLRFKAPHLWYFGENTLENLLDDSGFRCVAKETASTVRGRNNIQAIFTERG